MKKILICICIFILVFVVGCANKKVDDTKSSNYQTVENESLEALLIENYIILGIASHNDKLLVLYAAYDNTEISPSKIVIVDANNYNKLYELDLDRMYVLGDIVTLDDGFYINQGNDITVYDYQLEVVKQIDLTELQQREGSSFQGSVFSLSSDLNSIAYVNSKTNTLMIYDYVTKTYKEVYKLGENKGAIMSFHKLYLVDNYVGFSVEYIYAENFEISECNAHGRIDIETGKIDMFEKDYTTSISYNNYMLIVDVMRVDENDTGTGEAIIYDIENNNKETVNLDLSYNSFHIDILNEKRVVSYNEIGRNKAKFIVYQDKKGQVMDNVIPIDVIEVKTCDNYSNGKFIVYYTVLDDDDNMKWLIKEVELK